MAFAPKIANSPMYRDHFPFVPSVIGIRLRTITELMATQPRFRSRGLSKRTLEQNLARFGAQFSQQPREAVECAAIVVAEDQNGRNRWIDLDAIAFRTLNTGIFLELFLERRSPAVIFALYTKRDDRATVRFGQSEIFDRNSR